MTEIDEVRAAFEAWTQDYALRHEPNWSPWTESDCWAAYEAAYAAGRRKGLEEGESVARMHIGLPECPERAAYIAADIRALIDKEPT